MVQVLQTVVGGGEDYSSNFTWEHILQLSHSLCWAANSPASLLQGRVYFRSPSPAPQFSLWPLNAFLYSNEEEDKKRVMWINKFNSPCRGWNPSACLPQWIQLSDWASCPYIARRWISKRGDDRGFALLWPKHWMSDRKKLSMIIKLRWNLIHEKEAMGTIKRSHKTEATTLK